MNMKPYHKIQTVFKRDPANKYRTLLDGEFACPEFEYLAGNTWLWTEKIDGTNIRVMWDGQQVCFGGKTDRAQLYMPLVEKLQDMFTFEKLASAFGPQFEGEVCLYGEGFGARIQKGGGNYIPDGVDFILFDVWVGMGSNLWLERENVVDIAKKLDIPIVPVVGRGTLWNAIDVVRHRDVVSLVAITPNTIMEGLVVRPLIELCNRRGARIITKIKCKDFPA